MAFHLAVRMGLCVAGEEERVLAVLEKWDLPTRWGGADLTGREATGRVWEAMASDKKRREGKIRFVLPQMIGRVNLVDGIGEADAKQALEETQ